MEKSVHSRQLLLSDYAVSTEDFWKNYYKFCDHHNKLWLISLKYILVCTYYNKTKEKLIIFLNIKSVNRLVKRHKLMSQIQIVYKNRKPWSLEDFNQDFH